MNTTTETTSTDTSTITVEVSTFEDTDIQTRTTTIVDEFSFGPMTTVIFEMRGDGNNPGEWIEFTRRQG